MKRKWITVLIVAGFLALCCVPVEAQNECSTVNPQSWIYSRITGTNGVTHDVICAEYLTGKLSLPWANIITGTSSPPNIANVVAYGAFGDARSCSGITTTASVATIESAGCSGWVAEDVGKIIVLFSEAYSPGLVTTIASVTDSSHVVLTAAPTITTSPVIAVWGAHDDGPAIAAAAAAITAKGSIGTLYFPQGIYLTSSAIALSNVAGLDIRGDGWAAPSSLTNYDATGQPATGTAVVWIGATGGVIGCTGNTGAPPAGVTGAATNCTAAENYMLKVSGAFDLHDITFIGAKRASHNVIIGGTAAITRSFNFSAENLGLGYARQYGLVMGGTNADQGGNFGEAWLNNIQFYGNGIYSTTVAESDPTGGGDIFNRYGGSNYQIAYNNIASFSVKSGSHSIFQYQGSMLSIHHAFFPPINADGTPRCSIYVAGAMTHLLIDGNTYTENGCLLRSSATGAAKVSLRDIQVRGNLTTNPHYFALFENAPVLTAQHISTTGLPLVLANGGTVSHDQVELGTLQDFSPNGPYYTTLCAGAGCTTRSGTTVTVGATAHSYRVGDYVELDSLADATFNGIFRVNAIAANSFDVTNANAVGASTQAGTAKIACCIVGTATGLTPQLSHPFQALSSVTSPYATSQANAFAAAVTNPVAKNSIVLIPATQAGAVGANMPATIPTGWNLLDFRGGVPTWLGPWTFGTAANPMTLTVNNALSVIAKAATNSFPSTLSGSTAGFNAYRATNTGGDAIVGVTDSSGGGLLTGGTPYATVLTSNNNTPTEIGANGKLGIRIDPTSAAASINLYATLTNCASAGGTCVAAPAGAFTIAAAATTATVSTTAVHAASRIFVFENSTLGTELSVTCNTTVARVYAVTTVTANTSFVVTTSAAPITNPACLTYLIVN